MTATAFSITACLANAALSPNGRHRHLPVLSSHTDRETIFDLAQALLDAPHGGDGLAEIARVNSTAKLAIQSPAAYATPR